MNSDKAAASRCGRAPVQRPRLPPGPLDDLKAFLHDLYLKAGSPSLDQIVGWANWDSRMPGAPGRDSIARILGDPGMPPSQAKVVAVAIALAHGAEWEPDDAADRARQLWVAAQQAVPAASRWTRRTRSSWKSTVRSSWTMRPETCRRCPAMCGEFAMTCLPG
jgi:hypothetical protein